MQYTGVGRFASSSELTFQTILYPSGKMVFQYRSMSGTLDSASIGIQNGDRNIGVLVAYNEGYVHDGLAVEIARIAPWTTATPAAGVVPPGGQSQIDLEIRSRDLDAGEFHSELLIRSNDPRNGEIRVPVTLHTALIDLDYFDIDPDTVNVKSNGRWIRAALQLPAAYDPREVVVSSVSLYDTLRPDASRVEYADETADGIDEVILRFDRDALHALLPAGEAVEVTISGEVEGTVRFRGTTTVRVVGR